MNTARLGPRRGRVSQVATRSLFCLGLGACAEVTSLEQDAPSRILAEDLDQPSNAALIVDGVIGDFECALASYIVAIGLVGDELVDAQLGQAGWDYDRRSVFPASTVYSQSDCDGTQSVGLYTPLSVARFQGDRAVRLLDSWTDEQVSGRVDLIARAAAFAGYSLVLLSESMCSAAIDLGPELSRAQLAAEAESRFSRAIEAATAADNADILHLARVGRARARLNQGNLVDAAEDAALVPSGFIFNATYSATPTRRENRVYTQMHRDNFASVDPGFHGVSWEGVADPRVVVIDGGVNGHDRITRIFRPMKYPSITSPIPVARSAEARLIMAEAALDAGDTQQAIAIINELHERAGIPGYAGGSAGETTAAIMEERRRELFLEGHRLGDIIRNGVELSPSPGTPYPKGGLYGDRLCMPLPDIERNNNPNIGGSS